MENEKNCNGPNEEPDIKDSSRRNFLKQSSLLTAVAITPGTAVKAATMHVDEKIATAFEKVPLTLLFVRSCQLTCVFVDQSRFKLMQTSAIQTRSQHSLLNH